MATSGLLEASSSSTPVGGQSDWYRRNGYGSMNVSRNNSYFSRPLTPDVSATPSAPSTIAENQGGNERFRYWAYYLPFLSWLPQYQWKWLRGDITAALTVASLYIPMCFSFTILGQVDPISGLYSFVIHPLVYAFLGSCPQLIVGPEATGSLLVGAVNRHLQRRMGSGDLEQNIAISGVTTAFAGAFLLLAGLSRIGFVDSMLSRPFMQGFLCGVGFVLVIEQAIPELGLVNLANENGIAQASAVAKLVFLVTNITKAHALTAVIAFPSVFIILTFRTLQNKLRKRYPSIMLVPDRLLIVLVTGIITWQLRLDKKGVEVLGSLGTSGPKVPSFHWPLANWEFVEEVFSTSFLVALLGFFESSVTAKSLRPEKQTVKDISLGANRELIALGTANIIGGCFTTLPAFGGFGRSRLNAQAGGHTPMSSALLGLITLACVFFVLPGLYYVPKPALCAMASAMGVTMMEECPHDIRFFIKVRGWRELCLMAAVFFSTVFYSMSLGIAVGIVMTLFSLVKHSTRSRIQILGRTRGSKTTFEDADFAPDGDQFERCLIVRIPEPLTFANIGDLRNRLRRLEWYGTQAAHPSRPRVRDEDRCVIFDVHGLTAIDACATQVLLEIVQDHVNRGAQVIFCRVRPSGALRSFRKSGIEELCGGPEHFVNSVGDALRLAEITE